MADPLSVAASIAGLIGTASKLNGVLWQIGTQSAPLPEQRLLQEISMDLSSLNPVLGALKAVIQDYGPQVLSSDTQLRVQTFVTQATGELSDLYQKLDEFTEEYDRRESRIHRFIPHSSRKKELEKMLGRLKNMKASLVLLMQTAQIQIMTKTHDLNAQTSPPLQPEADLEQPGTLFGSSINPRYQRYLDVEHGLKFKPRTSHRLSLVFDQPSHNDQARDIPLNSLSDDTIDDWLSDFLALPGDGEPAKSSSAIADPSPSLHLIISISDPGDVETSLTIPFSKPKFLKMFETFNLPAAYLQSIFTGTARTSRYTRSDASEKQGFVYRCPNSVAENWALALSWNGNTNVTIGIILGVLPTELDELLSFIIGLGLKPSASHPMQIPLILCELQTQSDSNHIKRHALNLFKVELQTRMHSYDLPGTTDTTADLDFDDVTRKLNGIISRLSFHQMRIEATLDSLDYIKQCERYFRRDTAANELALVSRLDQIENENRALLAEVKMNQRIAQSQLDVVYNLVVQRDNRSNLKMAAASRDIAEAAKDDSSAMRTLAFMSIVFLPATFVASFFSMSMFDWKAPSWASVASSRLWLYWAISVPLTLIIMAIWYIWLRRDLDHEHTSRRSKHNLAVAGFKDISNTLEEKEKENSSTSGRFPRLRKRRNKSTLDQEAGPAHVPSASRPSNVDSMHAKPFERAQTGQGPRR